MSANRTVVMIAVTAGELFLAHGAARAQSLDCSKWQSSQIGSLNFPSMVFDTNRGVSVLYGGRDKQTWEWNGMKWTLRGFGGPPWYNNKIAYDSIRNVLVGWGSDQFAPAAETWEWDGKEWMFRSKSGPSPRNSPEMAFDPIRGVTVLYGGVEDSGYYPVDTWEWNGRAWTLADGKGLGPRHSHAMVYHPDLQAVVVHGGVQAFTSFGDMWMWDGSDWAQLPGDLHRAGHKIVYDADFGRLIMFAGEDTVGHQITNETWQFINDKWSQIKVSGPPARYGHAMSHDISRGTTVVMGGSISGPPYSYNDSWEFDGDTWQLRSSAIPHRRQYHGMSFDSHRGVAVLFGGQISNGPPYETSDTWEWNGKTWTFRTDVGPVPQIGPAMAFDCYRGVTVMHGRGESWGSTRTWEWDGVNWVLRAAIGPPNWTGMVFDKSRGKSILCSTVAVGSPLKTWEWDGVNWTLRDDGGPPSRSGPSLAYDECRNVTVLYGGKTINQVEMRDTWEWDGNAAQWTLRDSNGPPHPYDGTMTYDSSRKVVVYFTGTHPNPPYSDKTIWFWNGIRWSYAKTPSPLSRSGGAMVFDDWRNVSVIFGGSDKDDLWELTLPKPGDTNCDEIVNEFDLLAVINNWGSCPEMCPGDVAPFGGDGVVNVLDLLMVIDNWG